VSAVSGPVSAVSLRAKLVIGALVLVTFGLGTFGTGTYTALRTFLVKRTDQQLNALTRPVASAVSAGGTAPSFGQVRQVAGPGVWVQVQAPDGTLSTVVAPGPRDGAGSPPRLPTLVSALPGPPPPAAGAPKAPKPRIRLFSVGADGPGASYRAAASPLPDGQGTLVIAASLGPTDQTLGRLVGVEVAVGLTVLAATAILGLWLAGGAARPLERIAATADAIAAGDLSRRVVDAGPRTELGRVGVAINTMLDQVQDGFARRDATEEELRRFIADASHELATPLTSIQGYAELFERGAVAGPEDLAKAMSRIRSEADRMGGLIDDLLLLTALNAGRPVREGPVDLARVGADAVDDARAVEPGRTFELDAPGAVVVVGDEDRLRQVAANLTANARRHTPPGTLVTVRVSAQGLSGVLEVADHGGGLAPDQAARAFDRFWRADDARARTSGGGAGLGLAIVAAIVHAHGGRALVAPTPGGGATFRVEIPIAPAALPSVEAAGHGPLPLSPHAAAKDDPSADPRGSGART